LPSNIIQILNIIQEMALKWLTLFKLTLYLLFTFFFNRVIKMTFDYKIRFLKNHQLFVASKLKKLPNFWQNFAIFSHQNGFFKRV
jgi:hypothetical protein